MTIKTIALYPFWSEATALTPGVKTRLRKGVRWTQVTCEMKAAGERHVAEPQWTAPPNSQPPMFRFHLEIDAADRERRKYVILVLQAPKNAESDPEQRVLAPIFNSRSKLVYEFDHAEVVYATKDGYIEVRELVLDVQTGDVGTQTRYMFHGRYARLATRCAAHLSGAADLYPPPMPGKKRRVPIPAGTPNLNWPKAVDGAERQATASRS